MAKAIGFGDDGRVDTLVELWAALLEHLHQYAFKCEKRGLVWTGQLSAVCPAP